MDHTHHTPRRDRLATRRSTRWQIAVALSAVLAALALGVVLVVGLLAARTPGARVSALPALSRPPTITVAAVGDMEFDRAVAVLIAAKGGGAPLAPLVPLLSSADVAVGNLECPLSRRGVELTAKDVRLRGDPRALVGLQAAGLDAVSLANNHVLDYGRVAMADTIAGLDAAGIAHAGAGAGIASAWAPAVFDRAGATVAYLAFSDILPRGFIPDATHPGVASTRDAAAVASAIRAAKSGADYVVVSFHWGVEYADVPESAQLRVGRAAIDAGADLVFGTHPHVIQAVEMYKGRLIAYSLGDFVFDHYSRETGEAFVLLPTLGPGGVTSALVVPVYLDASGRPNVATGPEASAILDRLRTLSAALGTTVVVDGNVAEVGRP